MSWILLVLSSVMTSAQAADTGVLLQWPGSAMTFEDGKLQKAVGKQLDSKDLAFVSGAAILEERSERQVLIDALIRVPDACEPVLRPQHSEAIVAYGTEHPSAWIGLALGGDPKSLVLWKLVPTEKGLRRVSSECDPAEG